MNIFTLGPIGSYCHQLTQKLFSELTPTFAPTIAEVFEAVNNSKNSFGIVPLENIIEGSVTETLECLVELDLKIYDIVTLNINHSLCSKTKNFKKIISHPQALAQCRNYLKKNYKKISPESTTSTSAACQIAAENQDYAAIASEFTANIYNLEVITSNISNVANNQTKFAIICKQPNSKTALSTLAILTPTNQDEPGLLIKMLFPFQENQVNLTKIESRPNQKNFNEYIFFIEFEGDARQARARKILTYLEKDLQICTIKVLGGQTTNTKF